MLCGLAEGLAALGSALANSLHLVTIRRAAVSLKWNAEGGY